MIYTLRDMFLHKELPFGVAVFAPALKFLEALIFSHYRNLTALKLVFLFKNRRVSECTLDTRSCRILHFSI